MRERKICYDYYNVSVPWDVGDEEQRRDIAIATAREQARLYAMPCDWLAWIVDDEMVRVRRRRNKVAVKTHYHVQQGMRGGYMPDVNLTCWTKAEAGMVAVEMARIWRDEWGGDVIMTPTWTVSGSARIGHYGIDPRKGSATHPGYYIRIANCTESECLDEDGA